MSNDERKILQDLQTHIGFPILQKLMEQYIEENINLRGTVRRNTGFEAIWDRAINEGGELHLRTFFAVAEGEARKFV